MIRTKTKKRNNESEKRERLIYKKYHLPSFDYAKHFKKYIY